MDFFDEQDSARRNTRWLVVLFLLAVLAIASVLIGTLLAIKRRPKSQQAH